MDSIIFKILNIKEAYEQMLFKNEFSAFVGKNFSKLLRLIVIVFITFLALSFAKGSFDYLKLKMNNPYTNWVNVKIGTLEREDKREPVEFFFDKKANRKIFNIDTITGYTIRFEEFYHKENYLVTLDARTIEPGTELFHKIMEPQNLIWNNYKDEIPLIENLLGESGLHYHIIITKNFLKKLGYGENDKLYKIKKNYIGSVDIWLDILAAVEYIPNEADLLIFPNLHNGLSPYRKNQFIIGQQGNKFELLSTSNNKEQFKESIIPALGEIGENIFSINDEIFEISEDEIFTKYTFNINAWIELDKRVLNNKLKDNKLLDKNLMVYQKFEKNYTKESLEEPDYLAFYFKKLDRVRAFKDTLRYMEVESDRGIPEPLNLDVDIAQIESKENFAFVSALTQTISFLLFFLGLSSIVLYLVNLMKTHLSNIKKNLGTYKAFGFSTKKLRAVYFKIIFSKLLLSIIVAFALLLLVQFSGLADWVLSLFTAGLDGSISAISVFNYWNLAAIIMLLLVSFFFNFQTIKNILNKTPSNLIYS